MEIVSYGRYPNGNLRVTIQTATEPYTTSTEVARFLSRINGISSVWTNYASAEIKIAFDKDKVSGRKLMRLIGYLGL